jgi:asparagine synthetase B (glutamine-hydrolysing)
MSSTKPYTVEEGYGGLRRHLDEAAWRCIHRDVPVGALLSGGMNSSMVDQERRVILHVIRSTDAGFAYNWAHGPWCPA